MSAPDLTQTLRRVTDGSPEAADELFEASYRELKAMARRYLGQERANHTLQTTALVHEAYVRLVDSSKVRWNDRSHFLAIAARVMRHILVDHARRHAAAKRDGGRKVSLDEVATIGDEGINPDLLALDAALTRLEAEQPEKARVVEMRFFAGMTVEDIAAVLDVTPRTVHRYWAYAQARLYKEMTSGFDPE